MHPKDSNYSEIITESVPDSQAAPRLICGDDRLLGTVLDERFKLLEVLGVGGTSVVYKAHHITADRIVAVKVLHPHLAADEQSFARFRQETVAISALDHPNIVKVLAFGITDDSKLVYAAMEYIDGKSLSDVLRDSGALPIKRALNVFIQATDAIAFAHEKGILHRDLKTSNIMLVRQNDAERALIVDFGLAKIRRTDEHAQHLTQTGEVNGSPYSMSPEQCGNTEIDERSDIYSMGCVLYETIAGRPVFTGETPLSILYKHTTEEPVPPSRYSDEFSKYPQLEPVILKCLNKKPDQRLSTMKALHDQLVRIDEGTAAADPDAARNAKFLAKRKMYFTTACGAAFIAPFVALVIYCFLPAPVRALCEFHWLNLKEVIVGNTSHRLMHERQALEDVLVQHQLFREAIHLGNRNVAAGEALNSEKFSVERGVPLARLATLYAVCGEKALAEGNSHAAWATLYPIAKDNSQPTADRKRAASALIEMQIGLKHILPDELGILNTILGDLHMSEGNYSQALEFYNRGLRQQSVDFLHKHCKARRFIKAGAALAGMGNLPDAGLQLDEAMKLTRSGHPHEDWELAAAYYDLFAYKLYMDGHQREAWRYFDLYKSLAKNTNNVYSARRREVISHFLQSRCMKGVNDLVSQKEMRLAEAAVAKLPPQQQKELIREYVGAALVLGHPDDAAALNKLSSAVEPRSLPPN